MKDRGKIINRLENVTGRTISDLVEEATAFDSLWEYARRLCKKHYIKSPEAVARSLRGFIQRTKGQEYYNAYFTRGRDVIKRAGEILGVSPEGVIQHLIDNEIDLATFAREIDATNSVKVYSYLSSRISRHK